MPEVDASEVSVKVAVRIRPLTNRERLHKHQPCIKISSETNQIVIGKDKTFTFDYVLPPKTTQDDLYTNCIEGLVHSIFEGYNATVFAYGQTGSGKTYTISGNALSDEEIGIIPRSVKEMFDTIKAQTGRDILVKVSYLEIYKEELKDLLDPSEKEMHIREDESGNITINGVNEVVCQTLDDVMTCFNSGSILRHTGSTNMNEQSSRSHSIFTISVEQRWTSDGPKSQEKPMSESDCYNIKDIDTESTFYLGAKFHFVDLAGSERVGRTGNVGDRFKESIHINGGLLALGNVISALSSNDRKRSMHIPYRDSKITRLLKDSLGGNAKTLMICCISPSSCNLDESLNALKYASRARYIKNKPVVNMDPQTQRFVEMQSEIKALRDELHRQRTQLLTAENQIYNQTEIKDMEDRILCIQNECDYYKNLITDACSRFKEISRFASTDDQICGLVTNWFELIESSKGITNNSSDDYAKQRIMELECKLEQAQNDLKSDEEIFLEKEKEINDLKEKIRDLDTNLTNANRYLEASLGKEKEQQELMVQLQIQLDKLMQGKQDNYYYNRANSDADMAKRNDENDTERSVTVNNQIKNRAKTAPNAQGNKLKESRKNRNIFSSPALFPLEKVMQGFRARTQLLAETLEENDNVLQKEFEPPSDNDEYSLESRNESAFIRKGTYRKKSRDLYEQAITNTKDTNVPDELNMLTKSTEIRQKALKESEHKLKDAYHKMRDLSINIKMKEELIKELVANSKFANRVNVEYQHRIENLQKEANLAKAELNEMQGFVQQLNVKDHVDKGKLENEYKKKLELAQQKIVELETRQKETIKLLNHNSNSDKRIHELEIALTKMKQQQETLQKRIKDESDKKGKVEKDLEREQQRIKDLQSRNEQQQKILKKKTEDLAVAQRKLRSGGSATSTGSDERHWIEQEIEKIIQEKKQIEIVKDELKKREELCRKKELLMQEKNELQTKKLRSSAVVRESIVTINQKLEDLDKQLKENDQNLSNKESLHNTHVTLLQQRKQLDERLTKGSILSNTEERRLIEIEEAIEAVETAIQFESQTIKEQEARIKKSNSDASGNIVNRISEIPYEEAKHLIRNFFQKIIDLKEIDRKRQLVNDELQIQVDEKNRVLEELKKSLNTSCVDLEKRLVHQQQQYEKQIKQLMEQLKDYSRKNLIHEKEISVYREKIKKLNPTILDDIKMSDYYHELVDGTGDSVQSQKIAGGASSGFHLIASQQPTARTISSTSHLLNTSRMTQEVLKSNITDVPLYASSSHANNGFVCKDSLNESVQTTTVNNSHNQDNLSSHSSTKQHVSVKLSKKDLRPLSDAELVKRTQK